MDNHLSIKNIAIFASGAGSNMLNIARYFAGSPVIRVRLVVSSNPRAGVLAHAAECGIEAIVTSREELNDPHGLADILASRDIDYIVLAGWLWLLPAHIVEAYRGRIVNIHPSLLPAFGGRGMYGHHVHEAVIAVGCRRSGITIHQVDEHYDNGSVIAQYECEVTPEDTPQSLEARIHRLEHEYYPPTIERFITERS